MSIADRHSDAPPRGKPQPYHFTGTVNFFP